MVSISNRDRDKAVEYLRAYADSLTASARDSVRLSNIRHMARRLADRLERKRTVADKDKET